MRAEMENCMMRMRRCMGVVHREGGTNFFFFFLSWFVVENVLRVLVGFACGCCTVQYMFKHVNLEVQICGLMRVCTL